MKPGIGNSRARQTKHQQGNSYRDKRLIFIFAKILITFPADGFKVSNNWQ